MYLVDPVDFAREFAWRAHRRQECHGQSYIPHLLDVADAVAGATIHPQVDELLRADTRNRRIVVAYLHHVLNGTGIDRSSLRAVFDSQICDCIEALTPPQGRSANEQRAILNNWLRQINADSPLSDALIVAAADRLADMSACLQRGHWDIVKSYCNEHKQFKHAVWRRGFGDEIWQQLDALIEEQPITEQA